jgi:hypothetical protein
MELLVLGLVASIGFASYALWSKARSAELPGPPPELESPERTVGTLQVGDVVQHLGIDWLIEGVLTLSEGGTRLYRLADGATERFLFAAHGDPEPALLSAAPDLADVVGGAPERFEHAGHFYQLKVRETAAVLREGSLRRDAPPGARHATSNEGNRVGLAAYAAGALRLIVLHWADHSDAFVGERVPAHLLEFLPGK